MSVEHGAVDPAVEMEMEIDRKVALTYLKAKIVVSTLMLFTFWSAYGWSGVFVLLSLISGWIGHAHCSSKQMLRFSECCCESGSALINLHQIAIINVVLGVLTILTSAVAAAFFVGVFRVFAILNGILALVLTVIEGKSIHPLKTLANYSKADPVMVARKAAKTQTSQQQQLIAEQQRQLFMQQRQMMQSMQTGVYPPGTMINPQGQPVQQQQPVQGFYGYPGQPVSQQAVPYGQQAVAQPFSYPGQIPQQQPVMLQPGMQPPPGMVAYYYPQGQQPGVQPTQLGYPPQPAQQADNIPGPTKS